MNSLGDDNLSYDVRIWSIRKHKGARKTTYTVRWTVAGRAFPETFATLKLAESFRARLMTAARQGIAFDMATGLPEAMSRQLNSVAWYQHACEFVDMKWPRASARHRQSIAEALANVTPALLSSDRGAPSSERIRDALRTWAFNAKARQSIPKDEIAKAIEWVSENTVPLSALNNAAIVRRALDTLALKLDGKPAAANTIARKRAVFYGALRYAVELGRLPANPIDRVAWTTPKDTGTVDHRVVVNPEQARELLAGVRAIDPALEAFFACIYFAALRPAEALHLTADHCTLPGKGWGELLLTGSIQHVGEAWGDSGAASEEQGLKHRATNDTRVVPACPELVAILRHHIDVYGTGNAGRLFVTRTGRDRRPLPGSYSSPVSVASYGTIWRKARALAFEGAQHASPLARRPYDLRHACVSLWLNAGVPATQVAEWAGHSVHVLLKVYAKCIDGQQEAAKRRIEAALALRSASDQSDHAA